MFASGAPILDDAEVQSLLLEERNVEAQLVHVKTVLRNFNDDPAVSLLATKLQMIKGKLATNKNAGPAPDQFQGVGHSLFALLVGLAGGTVAVWFYARQERAEAGAG
jgi:hypothetical protein